ncbi:MAG: hypothetical protein SNJ70_01135 [Armatimonadota bacterium]
MTRSSLKNVLSDAKERQVSADSFVKAMSKLSKVKEVEQKKSSNISVKMDRIAEY